MRKSITNPKVSKSFTVRKNEQDCYVTGVTTDGHAKIVPLMKGRGLKNPEIRNAVKQ